MSSNFTAVTNDATNINAHPMANQKVHPQSNAKILRILHVHVKCDTSHVIKDNIFSKD